MKTILLNSAVMPAEGTYTLRRQPEEDFAWLIRDAADGGQLTSYIGYPQTAEHISRLAGVPIAVSREQTVLEPWDSRRDLILICKLRYRVTDPRTKGAPVPDEFEYFSCTYAPPGAGS